LNTYTIETATPDTLTDLYALHPDPADAAKHLPILLGRIESGQASLNDLLILRSGRGVEGTVLIFGPVQVPAFPRFRPDAPAEGVTAFARAIREKVGPERLLVLQDDQAPLNAAPIEAAGWVLHDRHVMYETDLQARSYARDPQAQEVDADDPEIRVLLDSLGRAGFQLRDGWTLLALPDTSGQSVALGAAGPSGRPDWASVDMIGVLPAARGQGLGTRLHAHLLALAAEGHGQHGGGTGQDNHAMRRVFEKNGSQLVATQMYFKQP
jgi:GNAT superfamily N-acetyltransferase